MPKGGVISIPPRVPLQEQGGILAPAPCFHTTNNRKGFGSHLGYLITACFFFGGGGIAPAPRFHTTSRGDCLAQPRVSVQFANLVG